MAQQNEIEERFMEVNEEGPWCGDIKAQKEKKNNKGNSTKQQHWPLYFMVHHFIYFILQQLKQTM